MKRKPPKILYVGRRRGVPADLLSFLEAAGYEVTTRSSDASGLPGRNRAFDLVLYEGAGAPRIDHPTARTSASRPSGKNGPKPMTLRALRETVGKTQAEIARRTAMSQPQLSRVEARHDHLTSTLRKYVRALGGDVEIIAKVNSLWISLLDV